MEHIYIRQYSVRYFRSDGRNVEGVDVPYSISGAVGNVRYHTPGPGGSGEVEADIPITMVRHQAKLEPPLRNLVFNGASIVITCIAEVTIFGQTVQGGNLEAKGQVQITFGDFPG